MIWLAGHQAVSLFYKEGNEFIISPPTPTLPCIVGDGQISQWDPSTLMSLVACESKLLSVVRSSIRLVLMITVAMFYPSLYYLLLTVYVYYK